MLNPGRKGKPESQKMRTKTFNFGVVASAPGGKNNEKSSVENPDSPQSAGPCGGGLPPVAGHKFTESEFPCADDMQQIQCAAARRSGDGRHHFQGIQHHLVPRKWWAKKPSFLEEVGKEFPAEADLPDGEFPAKDFCLQRVLQLQFDQSGVGDWNTAFL